MHVMVFWSLVPISVGTGTGLALSELQYLLVVPKGQSSALSQYRAARKLLI